jgi:oligopeptide/dipeptide ABC transporter ATP-binding protein
MAEREMLLEVKDLKTYFFLDEGTVRAVDGCSFDIMRGQTVGVVGESGCGKSVTAQSILRIVPPPGKIVSGEIVFHRRDKRDASAVVEDVRLDQLDARGSEIREIRGNEIALIFQEPMTSLSPVHTIGNQIMEAIILHQKVDKVEGRKRAIDILQRVGFPKPEQRVDAYPHQLSGGLRQRAMIAMALSCTPSMLIADEPTTALDVTTEAQILDLMRNLQRDIGMAIMFITHNLGVIAEMCDEVVVMYLGKEVERASVDSIFYNPKHPYTQALLKSIPRIGNKSRERLESIKGVVPDPYAIPPGCPFHPRCSSYMPGVCDRDQDIPFYDVGEKQWARCYLYDQEIMKQLAEKEK